MQSFKKDAKLLPNYTKEYFDAYEKPWIIHYSTHMKPWKWLSVNYACEWYKYTNLKYYKSNKKYFENFFVSLPVFSCGTVKKTLKKIQVAIWRGHK